jgi:hypothetical protein
MPPPETCHVGQIVLGPSLSLLVFLEKDIDCSVARYCRTLAPCRLSALLALISRVRKPVGRKPVTKEIRELIFKMVAENPTWRAPRIHGELVMLGFEISLSAASPAGCGVLREAQTLGSVGLPSCAITAKPSQPWTSSQYRL